MQIINNIPTFESKEWSYKEIDPNKIIKAYDLINNRMVQIGWLWYEYQLVLLKL